MSKTPPQRFHTLMQSLYLIGSYHKLSILKITIYKGTNLFDTFLNDYTEIILNLQKLSGGMEVVMPAVLPASGPLPFSGANAALHH